MRCVGRVRLLCTEMLVMVEALQYSEPVGLVRFPLFSDLGYTFGLSSHFPVPILLN
jgi:hypothetical protein